jgi:hypothetical protein
MQTESRRTFLQKSVAAVAATAAIPAASPPLAHALGQESERSAPSDAKVLTSAVAPWSPITVLHTERMPWKSTELWDLKQLFLSADENSAIEILHVPPLHHDWLAHYHTHHEWAFNLAGDLVNCEYASATQKIGAAVRYKEGFFLDRPPFSVHGFEDNRHLESQMGATLLIMREGKHSASAIPGHPVYSEEYKTVKEWGRPRIINTIDKMPWKDDLKVPGASIKCLADDQGRGFRVILRSLPKGWLEQGDVKFGRASYYHQAHQFNFVLSGDLSLRAYKSPSVPAEKIELRKYSFIDRPPMGILGLAEGVATQEGCVWLEVTYAKGVAVSGEPIEDLVYV